MKSLYICYFGIREPLVQTQVLPYLRELMARPAETGDLTFVLLTFEPGIASMDSDECEDLRRELLAEGIEWHRLPYHKRPSVLATAWDILRGTLLVRRLIRKNKIEVLHGRVHVPTLMAALARRFSRRKPKLLFDIRGFFPEEYTDAGVWRPEGIIFRIAKRVERWLLGESDAFVVLTEKAREILFPESRESGVDKGGRPVEVIPCCVDPSRFVETVSAEGLPDVTGRFTTAYVGSFGGWYLTGKMMEFFAAAMQTAPGAFTLILTQRNADEVAALLEERGIAGDDRFVSSVRPKEIPAYLAHADVALSFIKPCFSKLSSSPTKIAEYLAAGVPVIANRGVGDVAEQLEQDRVGVVIEAFEAEEYARALAKIREMNEEGGLSERCRRSALDRFDLERVGGKKYRRIYARMLSRPE